MPFKRITKGKDKGKYKSPTGRVFTAAQVKKYYATDGFKQKFAGGGIVKKGIAEVADFADAAAKKRSKEMEKRAWQNKQADIQRQMDEVAERQKGITSYTRFEEARSTRLPELINDKQAEWYFNEGSNRDEIFKTLQSRFNLNPEFSRVDLDDYIEALARAHKNQNKYTSLSDQSAEIDDILKKFSAAAGIPPAALLEAAGVPQSEEPTDQETGPQTQPSEMQRIQRDYGLTTQAMMDRYQNKQPLQPWEEMINARPDPNADRTHEQGYGTFDNKEAGEAFTDELKFGARYGLAEIPEQVPWLASMIADELPGAGYYQMATGQQLGDKMTEVEQNTHDYWAGKANTQSDDPSRTPEGLLPNMLRFGVGMGAETALVTAPFRVGKAAKAGIKGLITPQKPPVNPGNEVIDETRRAIVTGTPVVAATAGIAGLTGLKALTKSATEVAPKIDNMGNDMHGWIRQYVRGRRDEDKGVKMINELDIEDMRFDEIGTPGNFGVPESNLMDYTDALEDLSYGRQVKDMAIHGIQKKYNNTTMNINQLVKQIKNDPVLRKQYWRDEWLKQIDDYINNRSMNTYAEGAMPTRKNKYKEFIDEKNSDFYNTKLKNLNPAEQDKLIKKYIEEEAGLFPNTSYEKWMNADIKRVFDDLAETIDKARLTDLKDTRQYLREFDPSISKRYGTLAPD